jgi:ABC-type microcin C transport system duplicated ATPase subunit YejF
MFFVVGDDGTVKARGGQARWRKLVDDGQIHFARDHWHLTEKYANPRLQRILQAVADPKVAEPPRDRAHALALELLRLRLDVTSEAEFDARLRAVDEVIDAAGAAFEKELRVR